MTLELRSQQIFTAIINEYLKTALPVGSKAVQEFLQLDISPATIRNDMAELEAAGYIYSPHTSAGRVPTEEGYRYFAHLVASNNLPNSKEKKTITALLSNDADLKTSLKTTAKALADWSANGVFMASGRNDLYYTGLSNLFSQPEFSNSALRVSVATVIDHLDVRVAKLYDQLDDGVQVLIGSENPLGHDCSIIFSRYRRGGINGIIGVLGPMRMDYQNNIQRISLIHNIICQHE